MSSSVKRFELFRMLFAIAIALLVSFGIIFLVSSQPLTAIYTLITGPFKSRRNFANVIEAMIPLIFTGTGVCIMFSANQINLAGEGAFHIGGLVSAVVALELVSSLMLNYLAQWFATFILMHFICDPSIGSGSYLIPEELKLPAMIEKTRIHAGLIIALAAAVLGYFFLYRSRTGYELRLTGQNELFARYSGVSIVKVVLVSQLLGGFIAGVGGGVELLSPIYSRFSWTSLLGYGWDAIIICTLAKNNPLYTPLAALFLAYLRTGASIMSRYTDVTLEIVQITQGIIILLVVAEQFLSGYRHRMIAKEAIAALKEEEGK